MNRVLVVDGGGACGSWTAGALMIVRQSGIKFDFSITASAGSFNDAYCQTEQYEEGEKLWVEHLPNQFFLPGIYPKFGFDNLENLLRYSDEKLNVKKLSLIPEKTWVAVTNMTTLGPEYHCLNSNNDPVNLLMGSCRMPWERRPIYVNDNLVADGGLLGQPPLEFPGSKSVDELWLITPFPLSYRLNELQYWLVSWPLSRLNLVHQKLIAQKAKLENIQRKRAAQLKDLLVICPERDIGISWRTRDPKSMRWAIQDGKRCAYLALQKIQT